MGKKLRYYNGVKDSYEPREGNHWTNEAIVSDLDVGLRMQDRVGLWIFYNPLNRTEIVKKIYYIREMR